MMSLRYPLLAVPALMLAGAGATYATIKLGSPTLIQKVVCKPFGHLWEPSQGDATMWACSHCLTQTNIFPYIRDTHD